MAIEWTQAISVGDKTIDEQHKKLLTQINKLIEAMSSGAGPEIVGDTISYLNDYIYNHLKYEEIYMERHNYPELENHKQIHKDFIEQYKNFEQEMLKGASPHLSVKVQNFLGNWWINHISTEDKKYYQYIENNNSHPPDENDDFHETQQVSTTSFT